MGLKKTIDATEYTSMRKQVYRLIPLADRVFNKLNKVVFQKYNIKDCVDNT